MKIKILHVSKLILLWRSRPRSHGFKLVRDLYMTNIWFKFECKLPNNSKVIVFTRNRTDNLEIVWWVRHCSTRIKVTEWLWKHSPFITIQTVKSYSRISGSQFHPARTVITHSSVLVHNNLFILLWRFIYFAISKKRILLKLV